VHRAQRPWNAVFAFALSSAASWMSSSVRSSLRRVRVAIVGELGAVEGEGGSEASREASESEDMAAVRSVGYFRRSDS
jgi:hypothetical protein